MAKWRNNEISITKFPHKIFVVFKRCSLSTLHVSLVKLDVSLTFVMSTIDLSNIDNIASGIDNLLSDQLFGLIENGELHELSSLLNETKINDYQLIVDALT